MKYPIGTKLRKHLAEYEIIGHSVMKPGFPDVYFALIWEGGSHRGYDVLQWDAIIVDQATFSEVVLPEDVSRETS